MFHFLPKLERSLIRFDGFCRLTCSLSWWKLISLYFSPSNHNKPSTCPVPAVVAFANFANKNFGVHVWPFRSDCLIPDNGQCAFGNESRIYYLLSEILCAAIQMVGLKNRTASFDSGQDSVWWELCFIFFWMRKWSAVGK